MPRIEEMLGLPDADYGPVHDIKKPVYRSDWIDRNERYEVTAEGPPPTYRKVGRPVIVCLCGSTRFYEAFQKANYEETMAGKIVLSVGHYPRVQKQLVTIDGCMGEQEAYVPVVTQGGETVGCTPEQKVELDKLHKLKIDLADEVLILNVGGYIGDSTRGELEHARKRAKTIRYLEGDK